MSDDAPRPKRKAPNPTGKGGNPYKHSKKCNYVYKGHEPACRPSIDTVTGKERPPRKKKGDKCRNRALNGKEKCEFHGGRSLGRPPIHYRYAESLKNKAPHLAAKMEELLDDPELLSLGDDIRFAKVLIKEQLEELDDIHTGAELWTQAQRLYMEMENCDADDPERASLFRKLGDVILNGVGNSHRKDRILTLQDHKRRLQETETKTRFAAASSVSLEDLIILAGKFVAFMREEGVTEAIIDRIGSRCEAELLPGDSGAVQGETILALPMDAESRPAD